MSAQDQAYVIRPFLLTAHLGHHDDEALAALDALVARVEESARENERWVRRQVRPQEIIDRLLTAEAKVAALEAALRERIRHGHNDTCGLQLGDYPCSCGHDALVAALGEDKT